MGGEVRNIHLKETKGHAQVRDSKNEGPKDCAKVVEELSVDICCRSPARAAFDVLCRPSMKRISIIPQWPSVGCLEERPWTCQNNDLYQLDQSSISITYGFGSRKSWRCDPNGSRSPSPRY